MVSTPVSDDDLTAKARIRNAAFALIAEKGVAAATVRGIARRARVSPGLVIHHFGSKQGVVDETSTWVIAVLQEGIKDAEAHAADPVRAHRNRQLRFERYMAENPLLGAYVSRMVLDGTPEGIAWFRQAVDSSAVELARRRKHGRTQPPGDIRATAAMLFVLGFAPVLLKAVLEPALDADFGDERSRRRWCDAESELLTSALYPKDGMG